MKRQRPKFRCTIARTQSEIDSVQQLRFRSIGSDLNIQIAQDPRVLREISSVDNLSTSRHVLLYRDQMLIGTARLALPNPEVARASGTSLGFEIEEEIDLRRFDGIHQSMAEVARVSVLPPWRSTVAVVRLFEALYCLSRELGVGYWIGSVDLQTSRADEAELMFAALEHRGLVDDRFHVGVRSHRRGAAGDNPRGEPFYSDPERERARAGLDDIRISSTVTTFARRLGARCVGRPVRHPAFPRFVLPMLVALDELPRSTLAMFDLSLLGPSIAGQPFVAASHAGEHAPQAGSMVS